MKFILDDGGRAAAGYKGRAADCVVRALAIATDHPYQEVYDTLFEMNKDDPAPGRGPSPRDRGTSMATVRKYLENRGWSWRATMGFGTGCKVHLRSEELPPGRIIVRLSKHLAAVVDGVLHDNHDSSRDGTRCVYGYFYKETP